MDLNNLMKVEIVKKQIEIKFGKICMFNIY